jgi:aspartate carbamoyltransferase regulatory subunit
MVINAGDGKNQHPTQCLLDLFTIKQYAASKGRALDDGISIALLNDLRNGRTVHSIMAVANLFNFKLHLAYPDPRFAPPEYMMEMLNQQGVKIIDHGQNFMEAMRNADFAYQTRPQKERVGTGEDFGKIKSAGQITKSMYEKLGDKAPFLMHPLPIDMATFEEISWELNFHPLNISKAQASFGRHVRAALYAIGLGMMNVDFPKGSEAQNVEFSVDKIQIDGSQKNLSQSRSGYVQNGVVIDHITQGWGRRLEGMLGFEGSDITIVTSSNLPPKKAGKIPKDIVKIHAPYGFSREQLEAIALLSPQATINVIQDGKVVEKFRPKVGGMVYGRVNCANDKCVTNVSIEHLPSRSLIRDINSTRFVSCHYCENTETIRKVYDRQGFNYIRT